MRSNQQILLCIFRGARSPLREEGICALEMLIEIYERRYRDRRLLIALNMGREDAALHVNRGVVLLSTFMGRDGRVLEGGDSHLAAGEAVVVDV